jgi:3-dehydroquinate synthase
VPLTEMVIHSRIRDYSVRFESTPRFLEELAAAPATIFIVDETVRRLHGAGCLRALAGADVIDLAVSEERKCLAAVEELYEQVMERSPKKNLVIVSIGGGITQDITGFVASTLYRGVRWVFVPTTLLAQTDSCIGAKTSLNFRRFKNLIGTFYPPAAVHIHPPFLESQEQLDFFSGLGELAKLLIMGGEDDTRELVRMLPLLAARDHTTLLRAISRALAIKQSYIEEDEFDTGRRNMLNYGHCFGHALETATGFAVPHGQAVLLGMLLANAVAGARGMLSAQREREYAESVLLPLVRIDAAGLAVADEVVVEAMGRDKKRTGAALPLVMIDDNHEMIKVDDLQADEVAAALARLRRTLAAGA